MVYPSPKKKSSYLIIYKYRLFWLFNKDHKVSDPNRGFNNIFIFTKISKAHSLLVTNNISGSRGTHKVVGFSYCKQLAISYGDRCLVEKEMTSLLFFMCRISSRRIGRRCVSSRRRPTLRSVGAWSSALARPSSRTSRTPPTSASWCS